MRLLRIPLLLALLVYAAWPYVTMYRLDRAATGSDFTTLEHLVDLDAVQQALILRMENTLTGMTGADNDPMLSLLKGGISQLGGNAIEQLVSVEWVREQLLSKSRGASDHKPSLLGHVSFAFFESVAGFLIRIGDLGDNPIHVRMTLEDWDWRITAIYE